MRSLIIKKRYVYLDAPLKIENKPDMPSEGKTEHEEQKEKQLLEIVAKANREAEQIVLEAQNQAQQILFQAQEEYNRIIEEANQKATLISQQAEQSAKNMLADFRAQIEQLLGSFEDEFNSFFNEYCEKLTSISVTLVEKFLEKNVDPEVTKRKFEKLLTHLAGSTKVKIHINPKDVKLIDEETLEYVRSKGYEIILNDKVDYGVIAETELGTIDATLRFQLTLLDEIFDEIFKKEE
ncbi:FliH/SctL family protein [Fervidobacterium islandicum]|uniref:FliH/SctL family protein n=1 Tax=Fervidobacterium islandicum TaxID=2423 RepID=UPI003A6D404E